MSEPGTPIADQYAEIARRLKEIESAGHKPTPAEPPAGPAPYEDTPAPDPGWEYYG